MKKVIIAVALAVTLTSPAVFAQSVGEKTGVNSALGIAPKTVDFIKEAAMSDMLEIEASKIAQDKGNADEKKFAAQMITEHATTRTEQKSMVSGGLKAAMPAGRDSSSQRTLDNLRKAKP